MDYTNLTGRLAIAMPGMGDPRFERSVILLCAHGEDGAMGLILNKPASQVDFTELMEQLDIPLTAPTSRPIHFGGPVEMQRGFVLHTRDYAGDSTTLTVGEDFGMTATRDVLRAIAGGQGPRDALVALGYAGWGAGQLEDEIAQNGWLIADPTPELVFAPDNDGKWMAAIGTLGIDPLLLSSEGGRA